MKDIRKDYTDAMDTVQAPEELTSRTKDIAKYSGKKVAYGNRKAYRKILAAMAAAAVFAMAIFVPDTSAKYIKKIFAGFWSGNKEVGSYAEQPDGNLYTDEDKHIKMSVEEILSDEVCVQAVVKFKAKDEKGIEWLNNYAPEINSDAATTEEVFRDSLCIMPDFESGLGVGGSSGFMELEKYRSDNERYFTIQYLATEPMDSGLIHYSLPSGTGYEMEIDIKGNVPVYNYNLELKDGKGISKYYEPKKIRLSKLSVVVYGKDTGLFTEDGKEFTKEYMAETDKEMFRSFGMVKENGSIKSYDFSGASIGELGRKAKIDNEGCDCFVLSQIFCRTKVTDIGSDGNVKGEQNVISFSPEKYKGIQLVTENGSATYLFK